MKVFSVVWRELTSYNSLKSMPRYINRTIGNFTIGLRLLDLQMLYKISYESLLCGNVVIHIMKVLIPLTIAYEKKVNLSRHITILMYPCTSKQWQIGHRIPFLNMISFMAPIQWRCLLDIDRHLCIFSKLTYLNIIIIMI